MSDVPELMKGLSLAHGLMSGELNMMDFKKIQGMKSGREKELQGMTNKLANNFK